MSHKPDYSSINLQARPPSFATVSITATGTLANPTKDITYVAADATVGGAFTITLPDLAAMTVGQAIYIVNIGTANAVSVQAGVGDTVNGVATGTVWKAVAVHLGVLLRKASDSAWIGVQG